MKKILLLLAFFYSTHANSQRIYGVITYYFNEYQGDKADIGSKVTVIDSSKFDIHFLIALNVDRICYNMRLTTHGPKAKFKKFTPDELKQIEQYKLTNYIIDDDAYHAHDSTLWHQLRHLIEDNESTSVAVDGAGNYSIPVKPGKYWVFIQSNANKNYPMVNFGGEFVAENITVSDKDISLNHKFR